MQDLENLENIKIARVQTLLIRALCALPDAPPSSLGLEYSKTAPLLSRISCLYGFEQRLITGYQTQLHLAEGDRKTALTIF